MGGSWRRVTVRTAVSAGGCASCFVSASRSVCRRPRAEQQDCLMAYVSAAMSAYRLLSWLADLTEHGCMLRLTDWLARYVGGRGHLETSSISTSSGRFHSTSCMPHGPAGRVGSLSI